MSIPLLLERSRNIFQKQRQVVYHLIFLSVWVFTIFSGAIGIGFRGHWDEHKLFKAIRESIPVGKVLPGWYNYPSMIYDLAVVSISPEILATYFSDRSAFRESMEKQLRGEQLKEFTIRIRTVFLFISSLSILWTYLLVFTWTRQWLQALLSSAVLASSWEFAYHARWIAPDAILMQFGILAVLLVFLALRSSGRRKFMWLFAAAIATGLACATKYFGGIFLVPVFMGGYKILRDSDAKWGSYLALFLGLAAAFSLTFLLITPGALIETERMIQDIQFEINHYRGGDYGYTVQRGWEHLSLLLVYIFGVFFSNYIWISLLISVFVLIGLHSLLTENWKAVETWVFLSVPLLYIPYISLQRVMMVRNDLLLFPFLAILSAGGMIFVWNSKLIQSSSIARTVVVVGWVSVLLINYSWINYAAESIPASSNTDRPQELQKYLVANSGTTFYLSREARSLIDSNELPNVVTDPYDADKLVFVFREVNHPLANRPNVYDPVFGPYEVNFDYYPSWNEDGRIVVMPMKSALSQYQFEFIYD
ncbi:MAG TPA: phospholipid carrier-dependent glycosyltransferase [Anaerolineales bacterium]|nr:phospholipid carrier-dependent glycosyltransferase [Anaerolineales bacterium]